MQDISGFGAVCTLIASKTFPIGIILTEFADDTDAFDLPALQIADVAMGLNGDLLKWSKANPPKVVLGMIPGGVDDVLLGILLEANRVGKGKFSARDVITLNFTYPDGRFISFSPGVITDGIPGNAIASEGRLKSKPYSFAFENRTGVGV